MASRSWIVFQNKAAVEAPGEGAEVARQMFGRDGAVGGQEAVFDIGEHGICPAEGGVLKRAAARSEPVTWRSWMRPGCHAMH